MSTEISTIRVDIVSDVVCPWCVIGYCQLIVASRETGIPLDIHWHPFELNPHMTPDGENLREHLAAKYGTTLEGSIKARARITQMGAKLGFTFNYADDMRIRRCEIIPPRSCCTCLASSTTLPHAHEFRFFEMEAIETFACYDAMKNPDIENDFARFEAHLNKHFLGANRYEQQLQRAV